MEYADFEIRISGTGPDYAVSVVRSPAGEASGTMRLPFDATEFDQELSNVERAVSQSRGSRAVAAGESGSPRRDLVGASPEETPAPLMVEAFGKKLFESMFVGDVEMAYRRSKDQMRATEDTGLRVRLWIETPELSKLPWEFLYDEGTRDYIGLSTKTPLVRYLESEETPRALSIGTSLSILAMVASPTDRPTLDVAAERRRIEAAVADMRQKGRLKITWLKGSTYLDLQEEMRTGKYHIFHFVGHGGFDEQAEEGVLAFTNEEGKTDLMGAKTVARLLKDHQSLRLAVLNSCLGARASDSDVFSSTAATLVGPDLPAVVAMQYEISDDAAIGFSRTLYDALADGMPVDFAVTEARKAMISGAQQSTEWGTPVLHMLSPDGVLFNVPWWARSWAAIRKFCEEWWEAWLVLAPVITAGLVSAVVDPDDFGLALALAPLIPAWLLTWFFLRGVLRARAVHAIVPLWMGMASLIHLFRAAQAQPAVPPWWEAMLWGFGVGWLTLQIVKRWLMKSPD